MTGRIAHPIPYQGSKRRLASIILEYFPADIGTLFEPFAGSAAVSLAAAKAGKAQRHHISDSLVELVEIWSDIINHPARLATEYESIWHGQQDDPRGYYDQVRDRFNESGGSARLLFLLARCVKNAVRFNSAGQFNQSPDKRRLGTRPERMRRNIMGAHELLSKRSSTSSGDYSEVLAKATPADLVYMDPPYQGTSGERDQRYHQQLDLDRFIHELELLRARAVPFIISFDGRCGNKTYGEDLPQHLGLERLEIHAGRSDRKSVV